MYRGIGYMCVRGSMSGRYIRVLGVEYERYVYVC